MSGIYRGTMVYHVCKWCLASSWKFALWEPAEKSHMPVVMRARAEFWQYLSRLKVRDKWYGPTMHNELSEAVQLVWKLSHFSVSCLLQGKGHPEHLFPKEVFSMFSLGPLHKFRLGISKLLKNCSVDSPPPGSSLTIIGNLIQFMNRFSA